jgi:hypothetical protein
MKYYRLISLCLAVIFSLVGLIFLFFSSGVLIFFNDIAFYLGMEPSPVQGVDFYLILAAGYMYLVSLLAFLMVKHPDNRFFPLLLTNAKLASSLLSLGFFILHQPYLIYLTNCLVDGFIGMLILVFYLKMKKQHS